MERTELGCLFKESQDKYSYSKKIEYLKENSQFFTPDVIADKMIETIDLNSMKDIDSISILEPAAGCGILILKLILYLIDNVLCKEIKLVAYENDEELFDILSNNMKKLETYLNNNSNIKINIFLRKANFIIDNSCKWREINGETQYNIIISNPPFNKINKTSVEAEVMKDIVYGQPNIYTLFIAMSLRLLAHGGKFVVISPRNYLTGEYSKKVRKYIFQNFSLSSIHSFDNRNIFKLVNQEVIISTYTNDKSVKEVEISHNGKFKFKLRLSDIIYDAESYSILIPRSIYSITNLNRLKIFKDSLIDLGLRVSVGPIVQFRKSEYLSRDVYSISYAPILIANDIQQNNQILYYGRINNPKRKTHNKSISIRATNLVQNDNYLLVRKVTAKDDKNTIIATVLHKNFFKHNLLGIDNNLIYFHKIDINESLTLDECYGLYCFINSNYFEEYYSMINCTHTINISDFHNIKFPKLELVTSMGKELIKINKFDKKTCTDIMDIHAFN